MAKEVPCFEVVFPKWDGTVQHFGTKGQKFLLCPGTTGQAQNLAKGRDGLGQPKSGTGYEIDMRDFDSCPVL